MINSSKKRGYDQDWLACRDGLWQQIVHANFDAGVVGEILIQLATRGNKKMFEGVARLLYAALAAHGN